MPKDSGLGAIPVAAVASLDPLDVRHDDGDLDARIPDGAISIIDDGNGYILISPRLYHKRALLAWELLTKAGAGKDIPRARRDSVKTAEPSRFSITLAKAAVAEDPIAEASLP